MIKYKLQDSAVRSKENNQGGFTLIEMAVVMIIASLIIAALVSSYLRWNDLLRSSKTGEHIAIVNDALSAYAARNYRVPCPANPAGNGGEPFGMERGSGPNGSGFGNCIDLGTGEVEGILPFRSLGIDAEIARDGWGNFFTYQVDPTFTQNMDVVAEDAGDPVVIPVHAKCRTLDWIEGATIVNAAGVDRLEGGRNVALQKARFCCVQPSANINRRIQVFSSAADVPAHIITTDPGEWYDRVNQIADPNFVNANNPAGVGLPHYNNNVYGGVVDNFGYTDRPVFAIISHGKNEAGAFLVDGTANRRPNGGTLEAINADATNLVVYDVPHNSSNGNNFYDDDVSWQTQSDLMARLKRDSCALP